MMKALAALVTATSWKRNMLLVNNFMNYFSKLCNHRHLDGEGLERGATPSRAPSIGCVVRGQTLAVGLWWARGSGRT